MKRKHTSKRMLGILLTICMVVSLLPMTAITAFAEDAPGITITDGSDFGILDLPSTVNWNKDTSTLTLNGYNGGGIGFGNSEDGKLNINLIGTNTITVNDTQFGIKFTDIVEANFTGNGSLTINMSNNGKNQPRAGILCGRSAGAITTKVNLNDNVNVTINVDNTQEWYAYGIDGYNINSSSDVGLTVAEGATLNINMTSNSTYTTQAIGLRGSATINGTLNITGNYTGSGTISSYDWSAFGCNNWSASTIGANAAITIDYPTRATCGNVYMFKLVANDNNTVTNWVNWADGHSDYTGRLFYVKRSDNDGSVYADYLYKKSTLVDAAVTVTEPVVGETPNNIAISGAPSQYTVGTVDWWEIDGENYNQVYTFEAGKIYTARVRVTPAEGVYINSVKINGKTATFENEYGQPRYYVTFGLMTDTMASTTLTGTNDPATGKPMLTWNAVPGAANYEIYAYNDMAMVYALIDTTANTTFTHTSAKIGKNYSYKVKAIPASTSAAPSTSDVVYVTCKYPTPQVTGSNDAETGRPKLTWSKVDGATKYEVYRYDKVKKVYVKMYTTTGTTYTNTIATIGETYFYKVKALGASSAATSAFSKPVTLTYKYATPVVKGTNDPVTGRNVLNWEKVDGATKYEVYRYDKVKKVYVKMYTTTGTTYTNTIANAGETYFYKVKALGQVAAATSAFSKPVTLTYKYATPVVKGTNDPVTGRNVLNWEKVDGATKYEVYRYDKVKKVYVKMYTTTATTYTNTIANTGETYFYKVKALGPVTAATSAFSKPVTLTYKYATPVVTGSNDPVTGRNVLNWEKVDGATKYEVYRYDKVKKVYVKMYTTTATTYTNTIANTGETYFYKVKALGPVTAATSAFSKPVTLTYKYATPVVTGSNDPVTGRNVLNWEKVDGATKYEVYRYDKVKKVYVKMYTTTGTTYTNTIATVGETYFYKVKALGPVAAATSAFSKPVTLTYKCATPVLTGSNDASTGKPKVSWGKIEGATQYEVYRYNSVSKVYVKIKTTTSTSYIDTTAVKGTSYFYKVKALGATTAANSALSTQIKITCK